MQEYLKFQFHIFTCIFPQNSNLKSFILAFSYRQQLLIYQIDNNKNKISNLDVQISVLTSTEDTLSIVTIVT